MNMASIGILIFTLAVNYITAGNAQNAFVNVQCKAENVGQYDEQSLLECTVHTRENVANVEIRVVVWNKEGVEDPLLVFNRGEIKQLRGYSFAEPSWNDKNMNVSLLIPKTSVKDKGLYKCTVMTNSGDGDNVTSLQVTAKYTAPTIHSKPKTQNTGGTLTCTSSGGYPRGQLRWFDGDDMEWTKSSEMEVKQTESGLFNLSSKLTYSTYSKFTCRVYNASGGKENEVTFDDPKIGGLDQEPKGLDPASKIVAPVVVIGSLIAGLLLVLVILRRRSQQARRHSATPLMGDHHQGVRTCESDVEEGDHLQMDKNDKDSVA